ncbi:MAG: methionyl-tRNA formyltransferase [Planctomycetes bacterium]|nr:methionyl-tRNA formyltransferase [Planctomycetota bacterium]
MKPSIVFLGNHDVGVRTLDVLAECAELAAVVAHPLDPEEGVVYASVAEWAERRGLPCLRASGRQPQLAEFVRAHAPELLWIADYRYLLPAEVLALAPLGAVNLHPSLLPAYRGRAPVNWAILHGERELGLSAHFVDSGTDSGDLIAQARFALREDQDVGDALALLYPLYEQLTRRVLRQFERGRVRRRRQDASRASTFPRRRPEDGAIDWARDARSVHNLVRAVARPYPGAFTVLAGRKLHLWKARRFDFDPQAAPGTLLDATRDELVFACGQGGLRVRDWSCGAELRPDLRSISGARACLELEAA